MLDIAARHNVERNAKSLIAAEAKSEQILRDMNERVQASAIDMQESEQRTALTAQHIAAQKEVIKVYELQFKIARRTLTDVLSAYSELSSIEQDYVAASNDFRDAALDYLNTQAKISAWVGLVQK
ncbi:type_I_sec_TolC: type I secretion outer membrane protein, TolC family [Neisseria subflava]|nr:type_I_sec_TolC: type I secretion outer membrane protein, TolC family [Neisseria subflava]